MLLGIEVFYALQISVLVSAFILCTDEGQVFEFYGKWLKKKEFEWRYGWITKAIGGCDRCTTGQAALWASFVIFGFCPVKTLLFCAFAILFNEMKNKWLLN